MFWQLTIDCHDAARLSEFWAAALGYTPVPPDRSDEPWHRHYRAELGPEGRFDNRLFDPEGVRSPLFFQEVPEGRSVKNRLHLDLYPSRRDDTLSQHERVEIVDSTVTGLVSLGASVVRRHRRDDETPPGYHVVMQDPEGNEFCVS